ncbi:D-serine/D-alanine/glycine transporter [Desulfovibrio sp. OttesenSCG-928-G15]|nr:D-serine/D-alanine/glycine transporter [Desulfovibrio sp. OttesenSCG-928-G15]
MTPTENTSPAHTDQAEQQLERGLSNRHIQLIAIGGAIGTGLFMGSGKTISLAGPSIVLVYAIIGFFLFFLMRAMGELLLSNLQYKSFTDFCEDLLGPWAGFFIGWTYWFCWIVTGTADIIAISNYMHFWFPDLSAWMPAIAFVGLLAVLNLVSVKMFGEMESLFASIKIVAILSILVMAVFLVATGFTEPSGQKAMVANLWQHGGFFPKGFIGFFAGFQIALFAFVGIEIIGTTAAETHDPYTTLPRAINAVPIRIVFFYIFALMAIMIISPWNTIDPDMSPFVTIFMLVGIPAAAGVINFVVLTAAASSANSGIYSTCRMLYGLSLLGVAPKTFARLNKNSVPANALLFSCICLLLCSAMLIIMPTIMEAFTIMTTLASILFMFVWSLILLSYLSYRRKYPERHATSTFKVPGGRVLVILTQAFFLFVLALLTLEKDTRDVLFIAPLWFGLLGVAYYFARKRKMRS